MLVCRVHSLVLYMSGQLVSLPLQLTYYGSVIIVRESGGAVVSPWTYVQQAYALPIADKGTTVTISLRKLRRFDVSYCVLNFNHLCICINEYMCACVHVYMCTCVHVYMCTYA
jgi:hypothetical protein